MQFLESDIEEIKHQEWLVTNGIGGYASSSVAGMNTRRYHGLLVASFNPPTQRNVLVSKVEEIVFTANDSFLLATNQYPGTFYPEGYKHLVSFERDPFPTIQFKFNGSGLEKQVFMPYGSNTTIVSYKNTSNKAIKLHLKPMFAERDYHALFRQSDYYDYYVDGIDAPHQTVYSHYGATPVFMSVSNGKYVPQHEWTVNHEYAKELFRGQDFQEDLRTPGLYEVEMKAKEEIFMTFSTDEKMLKKDPKKLREAEKKRLKALVPAGVKDQFVADLIKSADQFIVKRESTKSYSILAGYHWFTDWGRDTMIALGGLCLELGRQEEAKSIFKTFFKYLDGGMLPNRFPDYEDEQPEYNTVDATLWLFVALYRYYEKFEDEAFIKSIFKHLTSIIQAHLDGTRYCIKADKNTGLLHSGHPGVQLTWMDAKVGDYVVTPRHGFAVEINALWYNALCIHRYFSAILNVKRPEGFDTCIKQVQHNFKRFFWNESGQYLKDVVYSEHEFEDHIRPNQLYAISLPFELLDPEDEKKVLAVVKKHLLTDYGMRTLNKEHEEFTAEYKGDQYSRDTAYHQGTVWPFVLMEYCKAYLKTHEYSGKAKSELLKLIAPLKEHFYQDACIHGVSEIFDGGEPKQGKGCVHQAWSASALIEILSITDKLK